ncbi:guanylate kinase [Tribonema minus]|uniref:guanylate kinase n=1 Tax=Tribonema minus TaxID=303371 RepID=A0A836CMI2_9STRA|nr:guanylate kinase [Tribonema minus]
MSTTEAAPAAADSTAAVLRPLVCCGPSGVGKGTLITRLLEECGDWVGFSVSHTTRNPRPGEVHGKHYYFVTTQEMEKDIASGIFIEHAKVHGNMYGTSLLEVERIQKSGRVCVLDIDTQGVRLIREKENPALAPRYIFIAPPSLPVLEARLRGRGTEAEEAVQLRIKNAKDEVRYGLESGSFDEIIVNEDVETAYAELLQLARTWYSRNAPAANGAGHN